MSNSASLFSRRAQEREHILFDPFHLQSVALGISARVCQALGASLDCRHFCRARLCAGEGKRALARKAIKDPAFFGERRDGFVVRHLVDVKPGFLRPHQIRCQAQTGDLDFYFSGAGSEQETGFQFESFRTPDRSVISFEDRLQGWRSVCPCNNALQCFDDRRLSQIHRQGQRLQNEIVAITIHDHPGQAVALTPDYAA